MSKQVKITAQAVLLANGLTNPNAGKVFTQSFEKDGVTPKKDKNGNPYGYIRVEQERIDLKFAYDGGIRKRSSLKAMTVEGWNKAQHLLLPGTMIDGQIIRKDSLTPSYPGHKALQAPIRDASGKATGEFRGITSNGSPVYRTEEFTDDVNASDVLLTYDKVEVNANVAAPKADKKLAQ